MNMKWEKKGLIYAPDNRMPWADNSALQPTPLLIEAENTIRIFAGFRDSNGVGRVGYIDVCADNPSVIKAISENPVLDIGEPGAFDDNGVIPCAVIRHDEKLFLYYAGYQIPEKVRFTVFGGLAISLDNGVSFNRYQDTPIIDRSEEALLFRVIHSVIVEDGIFKVWYGAGSSFWQGSNKTLPVYNIRYAESPDGISFPRKGKVCIDITGGEHRVGRPYVYKEQNKYKMIFGSGSETIPYRLDYAESDDGKQWVRKSELLKISYNATDFDSQMSCYPAVVTTRKKTYVFYNGNEYGKYGVGYAEWA